MLVMSEETAVIVDGYSTGNFLPPAFSRLGVPVVHVRSSAELLPAMVPPDLRAYQTELVCPNESAVPAAAAALEHHRPLAVLAGSESGVMLADLLSENLHLSTNGSRLSLARRDKYVMIETLRAAGIRCARQFVSSDPDAVVTWALRDQQMPVVVKPLSSASSENVRICSGARDVASASREVLAATTMFNRPNTAVLVQSYLEGTEYIVDTVSSYGRRYVCGVWEYEKSVSDVGHPLYDRDVLLDPSQDPVPELIAYVDEALTALGIQHGAAHAEVILTPEGPALVEVAARLNGNLDPQFHAECMGADAVSLTALAYAQPQEFFARFAGRVYERRRHGVVHNTQTCMSGVVIAVDQAVVDEINALPTVHAVSVRLAPGRTIRPTRDLLSSPMRIFMVGDDPAQLRADRRAIDVLKNRVFEVRSDTGR